ncbi:hypothetical protein niasHT_032748 [Heterodera trifolii]|uniref:MATH domain-containing protein n=1 Tax=Heterodera trifolii TaxID=157864 RepID=A0ABD2IGV8_9BILA
MAYIEKNGKVLFESEQFLQIDQNLLCEILDKLINTSELDIWEAAFRWADEKCRQNAIECTGENCRSALGPALFKIRFPLITKEDFLKIPSGLLTTEEMLGIYQFHCHPPNSPGAFPLKFPSQGRICDRNEGILLLEIKELSQFARENFGTKRSSETVHIKGMPWKILAQIKKENDGTKKFLGFFLYCPASEEDQNWIYKCSATLRIISQMNGTKDWIGKFNDHIFNNKSRDWGFPNLITFEQLMDPSKGLYDEEGDQVTLAIQITEAEKLDSNPNKSNGTIVMEIEKFSEFAREFCGSERSSKNAVFIGGFPLKINAKIKWNKSEKCLGYFLEFAAPAKNVNLCPQQYSATFRIVSQKNGKRDLIGKLNGRNLENKSANLGFPNFIAFSELLDENKGLYVKEKNKVTLAIDVFVEGPKMDKFNSNPNKLSGQIVMEISKFSEFSQEIYGSERSSETVLIGGLPWKILAKRDQILRLFLWCVAPMKDENWSCKCSATIRIISQKSGTKDLKKKFKVKRLFNSESSSWAFSFHSRDLLDINHERNEFYNKNKDSLTVAIELNLARESVKKIKYLFNSFSK